jgi:carbonic anhydrase
MLTFTNEDATGIVQKNLGQEAVAELQTSVKDFLPFPKLEEAVKDDVSFLKASKLVPDTVAISGWVYEVETGKVRSVV